ncbi:MAG TPA: short-chain dehydrogenase [Clostridiales bacterium]|nr:short-chain dehydrogenase [Clostridiales bacterium]
MSIMQKFSLSGCCSIVTGAAMGLGKAMAEALADAGSDIVIADIDREKAQEAAAEIRGKGVRASFVPCDVTRPEDAENLAQAVMAEYGRIDVLVNNAGICIHTPAEDMRLEDWRKVMGVNLDGVFLLSQAIGRVMIRQNRGSIINIASMSGIIANTPQPQSGYNASKAGVIMLTKSLASEWARYNIRVNAIAPGYMKTELTRPYFEGNGTMVQRWMDLSPMGRPGTPDELGGIAVYLASDASSFTTGGVFVIDGGYTVW